MQAHGCRTVASRTTTPRPVAQLAQPVHRTAPRSNHQQLHSKIGATLGAAVLSIGLMLSSPVVPPATAASETLADLVRSSYRSIADDDDGVITKDELEVLNQEMWLEWVEEGKQLMDPEFSLKLYDLNQDGKVTSEEVLRSLALDASVNDLLGAVDPKVFDVFDADDSGTIDLNEWKSTLGDLGPNGEGAKRYVFDRVDRLADSDGQLSPEDFAAAMGLVKNIVLGGGPSTGSSGGFY